MAAANGANGAAPSNRSMTALDLLRQHTRIDCDTLDTSLAARYGPFVDCTSNQAIAHFQLLSEGDAQSTAREAAGLASQWKSNAAFEGVDAVLLAVEAAMALLSMRLLPYLAPDAFVHIQVNPLDAHSTEAIVADALRIMEICRRLLPAIADSVRSRICIKIPSTWAGLRACRVLEEDHGVRTLATTLFGKLQGAVAAEAGCRYIAPYMHSLSNVMAARRDTSPAGKKELQRMLDAVVTTQHYYRHEGLSTQVLPAALMTVDECLTLRGVDHMTLPPKRIEELAAMSADEVQVASMIESYGPREDNFPHWELRQAAKRCIEQEQSFASEMTEWDGGLPEALLADALEVFGNMQRKLEAMMHALI